MKRTINLVAHLFGLVFSLVVLAYVFYPIVARTLEVPKILGWDNEQWVFSVSYFSRFFAWPPSGWDHLWFEGVPRVLDSAFLHHYLAQPLVSFYGLAMAVKAYPLIWLGIFFLFSYLTLFRLSKSHFIALALTVGLIQSRSVYIQIYENGVVLSGLAQMVFPLMLFSLVSFGQTGSFRFFGLAALSLALMFYSHGAMALVFGLTSAIIFLAFCRIKEEKLLSWVRIKRLLFFTFMTVGVGAIAILPQIFNALSGGIYGRFPKGQVKAFPDILSTLLEETNPALYLGLGLAVLVAILFYQRQKPSRLVMPLAALLVYVLIFQAALALGINPIGDFLFPGRSFWYFSLILACLAAALLAPLSFLSKRILFSLTSVIAKLALGVIIIVVVFSRPLDVIEDLNLKSISGSADYRQNLKGLWENVDQNQNNYRIWSHDPGFRLYWNIVSDIPQIEGYFHFYTQYSAYWTSWLMATLSASTLESQTIPQDMADQQALFLLDWYGIKYLVPYPLAEFDLAPRFWQENEYILKKSAAVPPAVLTIRPELTSGIVEAVNVPLVGFVGSDEGYDAFLRDLGMLNLNTHYLIPLRLVPSIDNLAKTDLEKLDLLVLYNFGGGGGSWEKIADFVKKGGSLFIETGGNPSLREGINLPEVFPAEQLKFGSLGKEWQVEAKEELAVINFEKLEPLVYQGEPWKVSYVPETKFIREESRVLLTQAGKPVVVKSKLGQGKIIWSGLNSWYRPWELKKNGMAEVKILDVLLKGLLETSYRPDAKVIVNREKPEKITIEGSNFFGVVFKENYLPGWKAKAKWQLADGKWKTEDLSIFAAGPDLMYAPLPKELENKPVEVSLTYHGPWLYWFLFIVSILSFILVIIEIVTNGFMTRRWGDTRPGKFIKTKSQFKILRGWWDKEEG